MDVKFHVDAWKTFSVYVSMSDSRVKKILSLIKDIQRGDSTSGLGKPEILKGNLSGYKSRHINLEDRLVYSIVDNVLFIKQCAGHY